MNLYRLRHLLYISAALLLGAHFLRMGAWPGVALSLAAPALLWVRRSWAGWVLQAGAYLASLIWLQTLWVLAAQRSLVGRPWTAAALILGLVAAYTALAGWAQSAAVQRRWHGGARAL